MINGDPCYKLYVFNNEGPKYAQALLERFRKILVEKCAIRQAKILKQCSKVRQLIEESGCKCIISPEDGTVTLDLSTSPYIVTKFEEEIIRDYFLFM